MRTDFGLVYVATGESHSKEALNNLLRSKPYIQDLPTFLFTDRIRGLEGKFFDTVHILDSPVYGYRDKITSLRNLPFDVTLFLDSDAFLCSAPDSLFNLSAVADFAAAHAPVRHPPGWSDVQVPLCFPEFNSGVMLLRKSSVIVNLINDWISLYDNLFQSYNQNWDQASLRSVLWKQLTSNPKFRISVLPPEVNLRTTKPWIAGRGMPVSVIHGRFDPSEFTNFLAYLNSDIDRFRTWDDWLKLYPNSSIKPRFDRTYS